MIVGMIPARMESTRFPGKPLAKIDRIPMLARVFRAVKWSNHVDFTIAAVNNDSDLTGYCRFNGIPMVVTGEAATGTDRCYYAAKMLGIQRGVVINIQADEPLITAGHIFGVVRMFDNPKVKVATLVYESVSAGDKDDVKVQFDSTGRIFNFTRIDGHTPTYFKQIGIMGFRVDVLSEFNRLGQSEREKRESVELLRCLDGGIDVYCRVLEPTVAVDRPDDVAKVMAEIQARSARV